jgi:2-phosphosulfolactate phosphatase
LAVPENTFTKSKQNGCYWFKKENPPDVTDESLLNRNNPPALIKLKLLPRAKPAFLRGPSALSSAPAMIIHTLLAPAELPHLARRDLSAATCVVFDILRATSTFVTALHHGAQAVIPVSEIAEALARHRQQPDVLLAGERNGRRIGADQTEGVEFDFGNSPREFQPGKVAGRIIVSTTTNGTRALRACAAARYVLAASWLNLAATAKYISATPAEEILLVCAGTAENASLEDVLAAGALAELLGGDYTDATEIAARTFRSARTDLAAALASSQNGRRLLAIPELCADVAYCGQRDIFPLVAVMNAEGALRKP